MAVVDARLIEDPFDEELEQPVVGGHDVAGDAGGAAVARFAQQVVDQRQNFVETDENKWIHGHTCFTTLTGMIRN